MQCHGTCDKRLPQTSFVVRVSRRRILRLGAVSQLPVLVEACASLAGNQSREVTSASIQHVLGLRGAVLGPVPLLFVISSEVMPSTWSCVPGFAECLGPDSESTLSTLGRTRLHVFVRNDVQDGRTEKCSIREYLASVEPKGPLGRCLEIPCTSTDSAPSRSLPTNLLDIN